MPPPSLHLQGGLPHPPSALAPRTPSAHRLFDPNDQDCSTAAAGAVPRAFPRWIQWLLASLLMLAVLTSLLLLAASRWLEARAELLRCRLQEQRVLSHEAGIAQVRQGGELGGACVACMNAWVLPAPAWVWVCVEGPVLQPLAAVRCRHCSALCWGVRQARVQARVLRCSGAWKQRAPRRQLPRSQPRCRRRRRRRQVQAGAWRWRRAATICLAT